MIAWCRGITVSWYHDSMASWCHGWYHGVIYPLHPSFSVWSDKHVHLCKQVKERHSSGAWRRADRPSDRCDRQLLAIVRLPKHDRKSCLRHLKRNYEASASLRQVRNEGSAGREGYYRETLLTPQGKDRVRLSCKFALLMPDRVQGEK